MPHPAFPRLGWRSYPNFAAIGPLPEIAREAVLAALDAQATHGVAAVVDLVHGGEPARAVIAHLVDASPADVALTSSTSDGLVLVASCFPWQRGDAVVVFDDEFPANLTPWQQAAQTFGLEVRTAPLAPFHASVDAGLDALRPLLADGRVRMVAVSAVQFRTGLRMPTGAIARLAHAAGARLCVDAIQAAGATPFSMADGPVDYAAGGGQKWLCGPIGTGWLAAAPDAWAALEPRLASWLSHHDAFAYLGAAPGLLRAERPLRRDRAIAEGGTRAWPLLAGLAASARLVADADPRATFAHAQAWIDRLEPALLARGFRSLRAADAASRSCILVVEPPQPGSAGRWQQRLAEAGVSVSTPDGLLRFAPSFPTALDEVDLVISTLDAA